MYLLNLACVWALPLCLQVCQQLPNGLEMFLCVSRTSKIYFVHGFLIVAEILTSPFLMYLLNLDQFLVLAHCPQVCQHLPGDLEMFLCVWRTSKKDLVHGALIEAEILTSLLPHVFAQQGLVYGHWHSAHKCVSTSQVIWNIPIFVRKLQTKLHAWGPNRSWDTELSPPPCICSTWPRFWVLALCPQVYQHLPNGLEMILCVQGTSKKFWCMGP